MNPFVLALLLLVGIGVGRAADLPALNFGAVTEKPLWIPMSDGVRLSAYTYFPAGAGPWPVICQLRYNPVAKDATRRLTAKLAEKNFVVVNVNFRGAQLSEGDWVGYRTIGWGERPDGYDTCEWLAAQPWSTGKLGTFGGSQAGFAQNLLAITRPPHLVAQSMVDTGLSLFPKGYRIGGTTRLADPLHPAEIKPAGIPVTSFPGARDARNFEAQPNVLPFTAGPLAESVEWTGKVAAELWVASSAKDTDFIVRVTDVYPDGRSMLIVDSICRARYREGFEREQLLTPGALHRIAFDLGWLSVVFNRGHRIRVTVASTGGPFYESNPNTGAPLTMEFPANAVVAHNTLYHHSGDASRIIAPVRS
ncbi:MAG: hypothetical protein RL077_6217 [Verrucomicrobiota bacterium]|jgi:predicted acyl esterase